MSEHDVNCCGSEICNNSSNSREYSIESNGFRVYNPGNLCHGVLFEFEDTNASRKKRTIYVADSDYRRALPFGSYFTAVFGNVSRPAYLEITDKEPRNIKAEDIKIPYRRYACKEYNNKWLEEVPVTSKDVNLTYGVPAVQYCRDLKCYDYPGLHFNLPTSAILSRIYAAANLFRSYEADKNKPMNIESIYGTINPVWNFRFGFVATDFAWTCNEHSECLQYCVTNKGAVGTLPKFYMGAVIPIIEID